MKFPRLTKVTRIEGIEDPAMRHGFREVVIANGAKEIRLSCDPDTDELRIASGPKRKRPCVVALASGRFNVEWLWTMTNQQGYSDGFRLQLRSRAEIRVFDFIAAASSVEVFEALKLPNQTLEPTRGAGTSAAEQPRVPAPRVAHL